MKINLFKIQNELVTSFTEDLENHGYDPVADYEEEGYSMTLYLYRASSKNQGWVDFYKTILPEEEYKKYSENLGSEMLSGVYLVEKDDCCYAVTHGHSHFLVRQYCDKDFGLNLAERIIDPVGLKMKHSQTFSSNSKKDITSYTRKRKVDSSFEYGEAFSYVKCKTKDKKEWGETVDFGESARFTSGKEFSLTAKNIFVLVDRIHRQMELDTIIKLPRYRVVKNQEIIDRLQEQLRKHFDEYLTGIDAEDFWMTGVSFYFSNECKYSLKYRSTELIGICDDLNIEEVRRVIQNHRDQIKERYDLLRVQLYDAEENYFLQKKLLELVQVTVELDGRYYVLFHGEWVEFSDSYVQYIKDQVDSISFELKKPTSLSETELIEEMVALGAYEQLHKQNVYVGRFCIEKADLKDAENVIMIKKQNGQQDLVYLVKQATTSLRLSFAGELGDNVFNGKNVCLWMLVKRQKLERLSDFKSFHFLDALNDFKKETMEKGLNPVVWISLDSD